MGKNEKEKGQKDQRKRERERERDGEYTSNNWSCDVTDNSRKVHISTSLCVGNNNFGEGGRWDYNYKLWIDRKFIPARRW